jgi:tRNA G18 (ribose-2'-O)-methylase SpoU
MTKKHRFKYISSRNNIYQHLEVVKRNRAKRTKFGEVAVEGVLPINMCISNHIFIKQIFFADFGNLSKWAKDLIAEQPQAKLFSVSSELMSEISDKDAESEIIILAKQPEYDIKHIELNRIVILDRPSNPGNFGAIVRTCNSFNIDAIFISGHGIDPYDSKSITASRGTVFTLPVVKLNSNSELSAILGDRKQLSDFVVYGSSARTGVDLRTAKKSDHFALIIGNETTGMTPFLKDLADLILRIPIYGDTTSLNAACAASILAYELLESEIAIQ